MAEAFKIRLNVETKRRWQAAASEEGVSLAEWVRRRCESGLPPKEIRVVTDVWPPGTFEVFPLKPTVHVDASPPEEPAVTTCFKCEGTLKVWGYDPSTKQNGELDCPTCVPPPAESTVPGGTVEVEPMVESIPPKPKPKAFNFSRCIQPQLLCQFRNMPLCGPCKELNQ